MANQIIAAPPRATDANGASASGAKAYFYQTGTTTPVTVYTDEDLTVPHPTPVVADSGGKLPQMFHSGSVKLKMVVTDSSDVTLYQLDPCLSISGQSSQAENIGFSPVTGNAATDVQTAIENNLALAESKVDETLTITAGTGLIGGGDLSGNRILSIDFKDEDDMASNSANHAPTQQSVKAYVDASAALAVGAGQTWQDVSGSRTVGVTYQNTTGKPLQVAWVGASAGIFQVSTDGSTWVPLNPTALSVANPIIPDEHYYRQSGGTISTWVEFR